ncbi:MAG TPA: GAF domain-containing protein, partial [Dehalococcoidia bacterium]|nr:GAF domain-containing protein [Dehalococcoidia bacterium]
MKASRSTADERERSHIFTEGLRHLAIELDRPTEDKPIGRVAARWASVLLESSLGVVAWCDEGTAHWHVEAIRQGAPVGADQPEYATLRTIVEDADLVAGLEPVWIDADRHAGWAAVGARLGLEQWCAARMLQSGQATVAVIVGRARRRFLLADELALLAIAQIFLRHLERRHLRGAASQARLAQTEWEALSRAAIEIASYTDLESVLNAVVRRSQELSQCEVSLLFLKEEASDDLVLRAFAGIRTPEFGRWPGQDLPSGFRRPVETGFIGIAVRERRPVVLPEIKLEEQPNPSQLSRQLQVRSSINVPIFAGSQLIGAITVGNRFPSQFSPRLPDLLVALAQLAAEAILNVRQHEQERRTIRELQSRHETTSAQYARLERSVAIREQLTVAVTSGSGLDQVLQTLADLIGRPVVVQDSALLLLASADPHDGQGETAPADRVWQSADVLRLDDPRIQAQIHQL